VRICESGEVKVIFVCFDAGEFGLVCDRKQAACTLCSQPLSMLV
jgi:hypothetical protein